MSSAALDTLQTRALLGTCACLATFRLDERNANADGAPSFGQPIKMLSGQKIVVVMPAYNAARTLQRTYAEVMEQGIVDLVIVVDDASHDETVAIARTAQGRAGGSASGKSRLRRQPKTCYRSRSPRAPTSW